MAKLNTTNIVDFNNIDKDNVAFDILPTINANNKLSKNAFSELANFIMQAQSCEFKTNITLNTTNDIVSENIKVNHLTNIFRIESTVDKHFSGFNVYKQDGVQIVGAPFKMVKYPNNPKVIGIEYTGTLSQTYTIVLI